MKECKWLLDAPRHMPLLSLLGCDKETISVVEKTLTLSKALGSNRNPLFLLVLFMLRPSSSLQSYAFGELAPTDQLPGKLGAGVALQAVQPRSAA